MILLWLLLAFTRWSPAAFQQETINQLQEAQCRDDGASTSDIHCLRLSTDV